MRETYTLSGKYPPDGLWKFFRSMAIISSLGMLTFTSCDSLFFRANGYQSGCMVLLYIFVLCFLFVFSSDGLKRCKIRNRKMALRTALMGLLVGWFLSWLVLYWLASTESNFLSFFTNRLHYGTLVDLSEDFGGLWTIKGFWRILFWLAEISILYGALYVGIVGQLQIPFSETDDQWCEYEALPAQAAMLYGQNLEKRIAESEVGYFFTAPQADKCQRRLYLWLLRPPGTNSDEVYLTVTTAAPGYIYPYTVGLEKYGGLLCNVKISQNEAQILTKRFGQKQKVK